MLAFAAPIICLLGGESTGKSALSNALQHHLASVYGLRVGRVSEHLRHWCETAGRAPHAHEQSAIADEQTRQIALASRQPGTHLVIADTSALTIATFSEQYFNDPSLYASVIPVQRSFAGQLLMGLDLPWVPDGLCRDSPAAREQTDALLRQTLQRAAIPYQTVYGQGEQRLRNALRALTPILQPLLGQAPIPTDTLRTEGRPGWRCEACSDPDCEHRLFTSLLKRTATP